MTRESFAPPPIHRAGAGCALHSPWPAPHGASPQPSAAQAVTTPADSYDAKTAGSTSLHRELQLERVRALRGPNIFRLAPVVTANVVPGRLDGLPAGEIRAITARVCDAVADSGISVVPPHEGDPGPDGIWAHLVARLAL